MTERTLQFRLQAIGDAEVKRALEGVRQSMANATRETEKVGRVAREASDSGRHLAEAMTQSDRAARRHKDAMREAGSQTTITTAAWSASVQTVGNLARNLTAGEAGLSRYAGMLAQAGTQAVAMGASMGPAGVAVSLLSSALPILVDALSDTGDEAENAGEAVKSFGEQLDEAIGRMRRFEAERARQSRLSMDLGTSEENRGLVGMTRERMGQQASRLHSLIAQVDDPEQQRLLQQGLLSGDATRRARALQGAESEGVFGRVGEGETELQRNLREAAEELAQSRRDLAEQMQSLARSLEEENQAAIEEPEANAAIAEREAAVAERQREEESRRRSGASAAARARDQAEREAAALEARKAELEIGLARSQAIDKDGIVVTSAPGSRERELKGETSEEQAARAALRLAQEQADIERERELTARRLNEEQERWNALTQQGFAEAASAASGLAEGVIMAAAAQGDFTKNVGDFAKVWIAQQAIVWGKQGLGEILEGVALSITNPPAAGTKFAAGAGHLALAAGAGAVGAATGGFSAMAAKDEAKKDEPVVGARDKSGGRGRGEVINNIYLSTFSASTRADVGREVLGAIREAERHDGRRV